MAAGRAEIKRWAVVAVMAAVVAATCTRTFLAVYLLLPLGVLGATAGVRAVVRILRGLDKRQRAELGEGVRSALRAVAWAGLCGAVVWGHDAQAAHQRGEAERFAMQLDQRRAGGPFPANVHDAPPGCRYIRGAPERFALVCTLTPPFEKATYSSHNKRWE